jgi:hypothetical protein
MQLSENDYVKISIDESVPCLEWIGKKFISSEAFRESEEKSLRFYREYMGKYPGLQWFVDAREVGAILKEDTDWVAKNILPVFASLGLKKEAFVVPKSAFGKLALDDYISESGERIEMKVFDSITGAKAWLSST